MFTLYLKRGVKAGVVAGLVFGLFVALVANPFVAFADELGHSDHAGGDHSHGAHESSVSTTLADGVSVVSGVLWGVLLGGVVFGIAYYLLEPVVPGTGGAQSYLLGGAGFVTVSGAPWLVLPPQSPGVEQALPTETRIALYGGMMVAGGLVCLLAGVVYRRLRGSHGRTTAAVAATSTFALLAVPAVLSPASTANALPSRLAAGLTGLIVFGQVLLWLLLAGTHARLCGRSGETDTKEVGTDYADRTLTTD